MNHRVKIKTIQNINHDVLCIQTEKPAHYTFLPGQATEVSINKSGWEKENRPFTFTCLPEDDYLEFTIKTYPAHKGVTNELRKLQVDDELILNDVFGTISYKGEGVFIAGGAGVTPFISILRELKSQNKVVNNKLIFANKTQKDIILESEFQKMLGSNFINILSDENVNGYHFGYLTADFINKNIHDLEKYFYICGPPPMMDAVQEMLAILNVDEKYIIKEVF